MTHEPEGQNTTTATFQMGLGQHFLYVTKQWEFI